MSINEYELAQDTKLNLNTTIQENNINSLIPISKNCPNDLSQNQNNKNKQKKTQRKLYVDLQDDTIVNQPEKYCDNSVRTTQYTLLSFLPLALLDQYKNPFNIYFLVSMIINMIPAISSVNPATNLLPVIIVLIINLIREAVEDYRKYSNDKLSNETLNYVYKLPKFLKQKCANIKVGNIVRVGKEETIPADLLIIKTSLKTGFCYMQTANLDGETALKPREAINFTQQRLKYDSPKTFKNILSSQDDKCFIEVDVPSENIYEISGTIIFKNQKIPFDSKNILLKGSRLKSVNYAFGIAIYTGKDTKLMKNINRTRLKKSDMDKILLYIIIFLIGLSIVITAISSIIGCMYRRKGLPDYETNDMKKAYIFYYRKGESKKNSLEIIRIIAGHFYISTVIPISIMIVNAVIKVFQSAFLENSQQYKEDEGDKIKCYSTTLIEQLGKIKYIFSDKTGTLTKNEMLFKGCSIYTQLFDDTISNQGEIKEKKQIYMPMPSALRTGLSLTQRLSVPKAEKKKKKGKEKGKEKANSYARKVTSAYSGFTENEPMNAHSKIVQNFCIDYFFNCLNPENQESKVISLPLDNGDVPPFTLHEAMDQFLLNIVTNHDVLVEKRTEKNDVIYQGISPDEVTLVSTADEFGYTFLSRENGKIILEIYDYEKNETELREFKILQKFDFTSERQSSAIILRDLKINKIVLYMKGSDRKIFEGVNLFSSKYLLEKTREHVDQFAHQGLRTLCYSFKYIEENEYNTWLKEYEYMRYSATKDKSLNSEVEKLIDKIESNTILLGATALEDKLQERVKRDIKDFIEADINFWMITGDKMDTAETIGHSCGIISEDSEVFKIKESKDTNKVMEELEIIKQKIIKSNEELEKIVLHHNQKLSKIKQKENNDDLGVNIFVPNDTKKNEQAKKNMINSDILQLTDNNNINNINISPDKSIVNNNNINDYNKLETKSEISNKNSEKSASPSEVIEYLKQIEKPNSDYSDEASVVKKNEELTKIGNLITNTNNNNNKTNNNNIQSDNSNIQLYNNNKDKNKASLFKISTKSQLNENKRDYIKAYDYLQQKLTEYSKKTKRRCFLFKLNYIYPQPDKIYEKNEKIRTKYTLIIEGLSIDTCIENEVISKLFYELIKDSRSLICCRASPSQKSKIVRFMKKNSKELTLAIGDGGNDVNMIKAADVGVGIFGKEGYQAAYNSDYAISQFKYLKRLLFVDGRFSLKRNSYFIYHYFYKNVIYSMAQFWFQIFSLFSGRSLMDDWYATGFNSFFTVVPIAVRAVVEEDFDADFTKCSKSKKKKLSYLFPDIYKEFRESKPFNIIKFIFIYMLACFISIIFYIIPAFSFYKGTYGMKGISYSFWDVSWESLFCIIITHLAMVFQDTFLYVKFTFFGYSLQIIINIIVLVTFNQINFKKGMDDTLWFIMGNLNFWLTLILVCGIIFIPFFILRNAEYFFGGFIVNLILQNRIDNIYLIKYCQKKIDEMTRINRQVARFMKMYKNPEDLNKVDNFADKKMQEAVMQYKEIKLSERRNKKKFK